MTTRSAVAIAAITILLAAARLQAAGLDAAGIPPDCRWAVQIDVRALLGGRLGEWLHRRADEPSLHNYLEAVVTLTGSDPFTDIDRLVACGRDRDADGHLLIAYGRWKEDRLAAVAEAIRDHRQEEYRGIRLHTWRDPRREGRWQHGFVAGHALVIGRNAERMRMACDGLLDGRAAILPTPPEPRGIPIMTAVVGDIPGLHQDGAGPGAMILRQARSLTMAMGEEGDDFLLHSRLETGDAAAAAQVRQLAEGMAALGNLQTGTATGAAMPTALRALCRSAAFGADGSSVLGTARIPVSTIAQLMSRITSFGIPAAYSSSGMRR